MDFEEIQKLPQNKYKMLLDKQKKSFNETDKKLIIQNEIYKHQPIYLIGEHLFSYICDENKNNNRVELLSIKWGKTPNSKKINNRQLLPSIKLIFQSNHILEHNELYQYIYCTDYFQQKKYHQGINNGWTWYSHDNTCEYAMTRIIDVIIQQQNIA
jgi:hypothetical protein